MSFDQVIDPATFLKPSTLTIATLLSQSAYVIPDYQRDYSWSPDEIEQLWDDLLATANRSFAGAKIVKNPRPHFLGPIVLQRSKAGESNPPEVMDGQQRLVTIMIIASVAHEFADKLKSPDERQNWTESLKQILYRYVSGKKIARLKLARDDREFRELVCNRLTQEARDCYINDTLPPSVKNRERYVAYRIWKCSDVIYKGFDRLLRNCEERDQDAALKSFLTTLLELTVVLEMGVLEQGVAYEVFETLNARGLDLQQADLIKNKLYFLAEEQGTKEEVKKKWESAVRAIQQQSWITLTEFLHFQYVASYGETKQSDLYDAVSKRLGKVGNKVLAYAEDVARAADAVQTILDAGASFSAESARDIASLRDFFANKYSLTILIAGAGRFSLASPEMAELLMLTHRYVFRRFVVENVGLSQYSGEVTKLARELRNGEIVDIGALRKRLGEISRIELFEARLRDYSAPNNRVGFYVVEMIENAITKGAGTMVQRQNISQHLEHIMPKRPARGEWAHVAADSSYGEYLNRIGNLLVLEGDINRYIKNKAFDFKRSNGSRLGYEFSKMTMPRSVDRYLVHGQWTFESIKERQKDLVAKYAERIWGFG